MLRLFKLTKGDINTGVDKQIFSALNCKYFLTGQIKQFKHVLGAQKNHLIETVLLSTHNICFGLEIRKLNFHYALLTQVLYKHLKQWA